MSEETCTNENLYSTIRCRKCNKETCTYYKVCEKCFDRKPTLKDVLIKEEIHFAIWGLRKLRHRLKNQEYMKIKALIAKFED